MNDHRCKVKWENEQLKARIYELEEKHKWYRRRDREQNQELSALRAQETIDNRWDSNSLQSMGYYHEN